MLTSGSIAQIFDLCQLHFKLTYYHLFSLLLSEGGSDLALLYSQLNNTSPEENSDLGNVVNFKFYDIDQIQTLKFPDKHKSLALFHINA